MGIGYTSSKLSVAIESLLTSTQPIQDRLSGAVLTTVTSNPSFVTSMTGEAKEKYEAVLNRLSRHLPESREPNRGLIQDNASQLNDTEATELVELFWQCYRIVIQAEAATIAQEAAAKALGKLPSSLRQIADVIETEATRDRQDDCDIL